MAFKLSQEWCERPGCADCAAQGEALSVWGGRGSHGCSSHGRHAGSAGGELLEQVDEQGPRPPQSPTDPQRRREPHGWTPVSGRFLSAPPSGCCPWGSLPPFRLPRAALPPAQRPRRENLVVLLWTRGLSSGTRSCCPAGGAGGGTSVAVMTMFRTSCCSWLSTALSVGGGGGSH